LASHMQVQVVVLIVALGPEHGTNGQAQAQVALRMSGAVQVMAEVLQAQPQTGGVSREPLTKGAVQIRAEVLQEQVVAAPGALVAVKLPVQTQIPDALTAALGSAHVVLQLNGLIEQPLVVLQGIRAGLHEQLQAAGFQNRGPKQAVRRQVALTQMQPCSGSGTCWKGLPAASRRVGQHTPGGQTSGTHWQTVLSKWNRKGQVRLILWWHPSGMHAHRSVQK
jgi:hypothetical protein